jgi:ElaB/YqjD/DUF883 family membrane-anchored ribosome-binding protein
MDPQPDVIRQQIDQTRLSLTEKLEALEAEVKETVQSARDTLESAREGVRETISSVKDTVVSARETVKRTFDIPYQANRHPWALLGLSLVSGVVVGALLGRRTSSNRRVAQLMAEAYQPPPGRADSGPAARPGFMDRLTDQLGDEVEKAQDLAIKAVVAIVDDVLRRSIPVLGSAVEEMLTRTAENVGAHPQRLGEERPAKEEVS